MEQLRKILAESKNSPDSISNLPHLIYDALKDHAVFTCACCGKGEQFFEELKAHIAWDHLGWRPYKCNYCSELTPTEFSLKLHSRDCHPGMEVMFEYHHDDSMCRAFNSELENSFAILLRGVQPKHKNESLSPADGNLEFKPANEPFQPFRAPTPLSLEPCQYQMRSPAAQWPPPQFRSSSPYGQFQFHARGVPAHDSVPSHIRPFFRPYYGMQPSHVGPHGMQPSQVGPYGMDPGQVGPFGMQREPQFGGRMSAGRMNLTGENGYGNCVPPRMIQNSLSCSSESSPALVPANFSSSTSISQSYFQVMKEKEKAKVPTEFPEEGGGLKQDSPSKEELLRCKLCFKVLGASPRKLHHVLVSHMKKPVYFCPYCPYSSKGTKRATVRRHIANSHMGQKLQVVSKVSELKVEIADWMQKCFGPDKNRNIVGPITNKTGHSRFGASTCAQCGFLVRFNQKKWHILAEHLRKAVYFCPYCPYSENSRSINVRHHVRRQHPGEQVEVRDISDRYRAKFEEWKKKCFPDQDPGWFSRNSNGGCSTPTPGSSRAVSVDPNANLFQWSQDPTSPVAVGPENSAKSSETDQIGLPVCEKKSVEIKAEIPDVDEGSESKKAVESAEVSGNDGDLRSEFSLEIASKNSQVSSPYFHDGVQVKVEPVCLEENYTSPRSVKREMEEEGCSLFERVFADSCLKKRKNEENNVQTENLPKRKD